LSGREGEKRWEEEGRKGGERRRKGYGGAEGGRGEEGVMEEGVSIEAVPVFCELSLWISNQTNMSKCVYVVCMGTSSPFSRALERVHVHGKEKM